MNNKLAPLAALLSLTLAACAADETPASESTGSLEKQPPKGVEVDPPASLALPEIPEIGPVAKGETVRILRDATTNVIVSLTSKNVRCNAQGYGLPELKISVPDLDWLAHFDHRVFGEGEPCMTGGACSPTFQPTQFIDDKAPLSVVPVRVQLREHIVVDAKKKTCTRSLEEYVGATVKGHAFNHFRSGDVEPADYTTCLAIAAL